MSHVVAKCDGAIVVTYKIPKQHVESSGPGNASVGRTMQGIGRVANERIIKHNTAQFSCRSRLASALFYRTALVLLECWRDRVGMGCEFTAGTVTQYDIGQGD